MFRQEPLSSFYSPISTKIEFKSDLRDHVKWVYHNVHNLKSDSKRTYTTGIQRATLLALFVPILVNLYRRNGDKAALGLTDEDVKALQIAMLFVDARWNDPQASLEKSGNLLYDYLVKVLQYHPKKSELFAKFITRDKGLNNFDSIFQNIIHDADILEDVCSTTPFKFYELHAKNNKNAFLDLVILVREARSILEGQGVGRDYNLSVQRQFDNENVYDLILKTFQRTDDSIPRLASPNPQNFLQLFPAFLTLRSEDTLKKISFEKKLAEYKKKEDIFKSGSHCEAGIENGDVLFRGWRKPSVLMQKKLSLGKERKESMAAFEIYKIGRGPQGKWPARSVNPAKKNISSKKYFLNRSAMLCGFGNSPYTPVGILFEVNFEHIHNISKTNIFSGTGKKTDFKADKLSLKQKQDQLNDLIFALKRGEGNTGNNEIVCDVDQIRAIYICPDKTLIGCNSSCPLYTLILEAIFIQKEYEKMAHVKLPIFEYSGIHNYVIARDYTDDEIVSMWEQTAISYLKKNVFGPMLEPSLSLDFFKFIIMYNDSITGVSSTDPRISFSIQPVDANYSLALKAKINEVVLKTIETYQPHLKYKILLPENLQNESKEVSDTFLQAVESPTVNFLEKSLFKLIWKNPNLIETNQTAKLKLINFLNDHKITFSKKRKSSSSPSSAGYFASSISDHPRLLNLPFNSLKENKKFIFLLKKFSNQQFVNYQKIIIQQLQNMKYKINVTFIKEMINIIKLFNLEKHKDFQDFDLIAIDSYFMNLNEEKEAPELLTNFHIFLEIPKKLINEDHIRILLNKLTYFEEILTKNSELSINGLDITIEDVQAFKKSLSDCFTEAYQKCMDKKKTILGLT